MWKRTQPDSDGAGDAWATLYAEQSEPVNAWLRLASSGWDQPQRTIEAREKLRRSRLVAWLILGLLVGVVILSPLGLQDARARWVLGAWVLGLVLAAVLNRRSYVTAAGVTLVALISGGILAANLASPIGLTMGELPNFDAYVVPVVIAASVLPRASGFAVAALNSLLIAGNYAWQPHNANIAQDVHLYSSATVQTISLLVRPIALLFVLAVVAYLWRRGTDRAIRRADRAEEIAELERREIERTREIEDGVNQLLAVHVRLANGDFGARVPPLSSAPLWQIGNSLNHLIARLTHFAQVDAILGRTQQTATAVVDVIQRWQQGQNAVLPAPADTPLDPLLALLQHTAGAQRATRSFPTGAPGAGAHPSSSPSSGPNSGFGPGSGASGTRLSGSSAPPAPFEGPWQAGSPPASEADRGHASDPWHPGPGPTEGE
ncbi:MAG TPA: hypothetical protein VF116_22720 [Ktedonobacterales bacterium]